VILAGTTLSSRGARIGGIAAQSPGWQRAAGFLLSLRRVHRRVGAGGTLELLAARALPRLLSYQRTLIIETPLKDGELHPELRPLQVRRRDPATEAFHARLASTGEPEVPAFTSEVLDQPFAAGHELWLFHDGDAAAHARWVVSDHLRLAGLEIPLASDERVTEAVATVTGLRARGLNARAREHVRAVLAGEGATRMLCGINGFNRRFAATTLRIEGARLLAVIHAVSVGGRRWVRAAPSATDGVELLARAGVRAGRWVPDPSRLQAESDVWDGAATRVRERPYLDRQMASVKRREHLHLLERWLPDLGNATVLKTDLWEEGVTGDELLFALAPRARCAHGVDISSRTVSSAWRTAARAGIAVRLTRADLRRLPFADASIDAVVSTSTLDHLPKCDRLAALRELRRVLSPDGVLVLTCDNADNIGDPLLRIAAGLGRVPFPLGPSVSLPELQGLLASAGFECRNHCYLVHGPRVMTTVLTRGLRLLPHGVGGLAVAQMLRVFAAFGRRAPSRLGAFVAVRAEPRTSTERIGATDRDERALEKPATSASARAGDGVSQGRG
jgi:SAM-dependent methyltransferase